MRDVRACAATGALQADTATPLLRCARCRSTHYVDAARQRAHWPAHRRTCLPLGDGEKERVANLKAPRAFAELAGDLRAGGSARTVALLRRCRVVLDQGAPPGDFEATCHGAARAFARASDATVAALLAAPGLAAYLLCGDDCLTPAARATRAAGFPRGLPQADAFGARGDAYAACARRERREWEAGGRAGTAAFATVYVALAGAGGARRAAPPGPPADDARGAARAGALAAACRARVLGLWGDVAARECGGDAFAAAPGLALLLLRTERAAGSEPWRGHLDEARRVPKGPVVCAALADLADAAAPRACREVLEAAVRRADACRRAAPAQPPGPTRVDSRTDVARGHGGFRDYWAAVPFADRAAVCAAAAHALLDGCDDAGVLGRLVDDAAQRPRAASAARDAAVRHRVLSAAAGAHRAGLVGRPGDDDEARAVLAGVLRAAHRRAYPALAALWGARLLRFAPERAVERCCAFAAVFADADADVAARAAAWEATPWPRDRDDAAAREKLACAELAAGRPLDDCAARDSDDSESELTTFTLNDAASLASYGVFAPE
ncbi:unnamed protein product [Pelagomonas calceolata]|jgi:hypothetical protein|uniref:MYND-type domain-containing protein n=1 Tax=Pelagomonas calceolata TaxID=35677 RepID=A0A8J2S576_9STRA|nr:unnamed protein product [Pelagomonas calceolata]